MFRSLLATLLLFFFVVMIASFNQVEGSCAGDDGNFKFLQSVKSSSGTIYKDIRKCPWIASKFEKRMKHCKYGHVQGGCPLTCGECKCEDTDGFTFTLARSQTNASCEWFTANKKKAHIRRLRYCFPGSPYFGDGEIGRNCKRSCGFCSATYDTNPEEEYSSTATTQTYTEEVASSNQPPSGETPDEEDFNLCPDDIHDNTSFKWKLSSWTCSKLIKSTDEDVTKRRRAIHCVIHEVMANCPHACALCCDDNPEFRFITPDGRKKACAYITNNADEDVIEKRQKKFCYMIDSAVVLDNCAKRRLYARRKNQNFIIIK